MTDVPPPPPAADFFVPGLPQPGGSKKGFVVNGRAVITEDNVKSKPWRAVVALYAQTHFLLPPLACPLSLDVTFVLPRPKTHFGTGRNAAAVRAGAPAHPAVRPDCTKLLRSTEDALKGICWLDDSLIVEQTVRKVYGDRAGARIVVRVMGETRRPTP